ncbi:MAG: DUF4166 domain-containing protein [Betaproteobacteria bacterium]|nr:DUF4166 domain-containing protein [Betaproteobacteria bacterium]MCL2885529.1 DUF4166 domain-containing protein [Betaproteobacteria bacterium]
MKSLMQRALGADWEELPPALRTHYRFGASIDSGYMDIEYPRFMQPFLTILGVIGALVNRGGKDVRTVVDKRVVGDRQYWRRTLSYPDGRVIHFNSFWVDAGNGELIEFVNPALGLQMAPYWQDGRLCYRGIRFVAKLGPLLLPIPEWLLLGHTTIVEEAVDENHFVMDFRLTHPLFGQVFRYSGKFEAAAVESA